MAQSHVRLLMPSAMLVLMACAVTVATAGSRSGGTRSRMMNVFVQDQGTWRLLARSITPCIERAIARALLTCAPR